jgi:hypothetical protein
MIPLYYQGFDLLITRSMLLIHYSKGQVLGKRFEVKIFCLHPQVSEANDLLLSIDFLHVL